MQQSSRDQWCTWTELAGSISWFTMDYAWFEEAASLAAALAVPTSLCSVAVVLLTDGKASSRLVAAAMAAWAVMNSLWMMHDLDVFHAPWSVRACFLLGAGLLAAASARHGKLHSLARELIAGFSRLRVPW